MTPGRLLLAAGALALGLGLTACGDNDGPAGPKPDVVVILIDTLRPDHLEVYGYHEQTAPWIAEVGARGAVCERAYSSSAWTPPSTASVFTGLYPTGHGLVHGFETNDFVRKQIEKGLQVEIEIATLPEDYKTLPERFQEAGYTTWGVATNPHITEFFGFDRGFDRFQARRSESATTVVDWLIARKAQIADVDKPYFMYLHLNDVHKPYHKRAPWYSPGDDEISENIAQYNSGISYVDAELRRLSEAYGWDENTLLVLISDHGEAFMEHGFNGHGSSLHTELNRVLMIFAGPGVDPGRVTANTSLVDVMPTTLELAGIKKTDADGVSLRHLLKAESRAAETKKLNNRVLYAHRRGMSTNAVDSAMNPTNLWSALHGDWRLIQDEVAGFEGLYDLSQDPLEQDNRLEAEAERAEDLRGALQLFIDRGIREAGAGARISMDKDLLDDLAAQGYAGGDG